MARDKLLQEKVIVLKAMTPVMVSLCQKYSKADGRSNSKADKLVRAASLAEDKVNLVRVPDMRPVKDLIRQEHTSIKVE